VVAFFDDEDEIALIRRELLVNLMSTIPCSDLKILEVRPVFWLKRMS
jgi:hypothetical protein